MPTWRLAQGGAGRSVAAILLLVSGAVACSNGGGTSAATPAPAFAPGSPPSSPDVASAIIAGIEVADDGDPSLPATVVDATGAESTVTSTERIVPANGDLAEVVFALGFGDQVVARDMSATFPPEVQAVPSVGYQRTLPLEPLVALEPTVVLANTEAGPPETIAGLRDLGFPVVVLDYPDTLDGPAEKIRAVAAVLGVESQGEALAQRVTDEIRAAAADVRTADEAPRVAALYLRGEAVQIVFGPGSGMSALLGAAGALDIGAELSVEETAPVNLEALLAARPDALVVTESGLASVGGVEGLLDLGGGALRRTPAGEARRVLAYDDQLLLGFGPRTGLALRMLVSDLHPDLGVPDG